MSRAGPLARPDADTDTDTDADADADADTIRPDRRADVDRHLRRRRGLRDHELRGLLCVPGLRTRRPHRALEHGGHGCTAAVPGRSVQHGSLQGDALQARRDRCEFHRRMSEQRVRRRSQAVAFHMSAPTREDIDAMPGLVAFGREVVRGGRPRTDDVLCTAFAALEAA
jgi:hypothetical protein